MSQNLFYVQVRGYHLLLRGKSVLICMKGPNERVKLFHKIGISVALFYPTCADGHRRGETALHPTEPPRGTGGVPRGTGEGGAAVPAQEPIQVRRRSLRGQAQEQKSG